VQFSGDPRGTFTGRTVMTGAHKRKTANKAHTETTPKEGRQVPTERKNRREEHLTAAQEVALKREREEYRHGGIPCGSDPRE